MARECTPTLLNLVRLRGRVSASAEERLLPSGDSLVTFRLVVPRGLRARRRSRQTVDVIECVAWTARLRSKALRLPSDAEVEVEGELRRRFTRAGGSPVSFVSVELTSLSTVRSAATDMS